MSVLFKADGHIYESVDPEEKIKWVSVTRLVEQFKEPFDALSASEKSSTNRKSKWYKMAPEKIREVWDKERKRSTDLGTWYHKKREDQLRETFSIQRQAKALPVIFTEERNGMKIAPAQRLKEGVYPEHFVYLKSVGVCGQSDYVEVVDGRINIRDYKTNKEIKTEAERSWDGYAYKLLSPLNHLEKCELVTYGLQLSIYMYIMLRHNPQLQPGDMVLEHIIFEKEGDDEFGYPITKYDEKGDPIVKEIVEYSVPFYRDEVLTMLEWLQENRDNLTEKK